MDVIHIAGPSGSGKTTRLVELIRKAVAEGRSVGAIKHTHHPLNLENRGDTARFLAAGATPVILASETEAVVWSAAALPPLPIKLTRSAETAAALRMDELLAHARPAEIVLVEGFKEYRGWPRIELIHDTWQ